MDSETEKTPQTSSRNGRMKVLFLSAAGRIGGAERSLYELVCALPEDQIEVHACVPPESPLSRMFSLAEVRVHPVPLRRFRRTLHPFVLAGQVKALFLGSKAVVKLARDLDIDVIHANTNSAALIAWEVFRESGRPFIWHCRDMRPLGPLSRLLAGYSHCGVAISQAVARHLREQGVASDHVRCVMNGIDLLRMHAPEDRARVRERTRAYLGIDPDTPVLIDIGAWVPWKQHEVFLETLAGVRREMPNAIGLLVGSDLFQENIGYASFLESRMDALDLHDGSLMVLQQRDDVPDLLAASDLMLTASENEPFGRVLVEASAAGVPVVSSDSGAKGEIVLHEETGLLIPSKDAQAMTEACLSLLRDEALRTRMGAQARERALQKFDVRRTAREMADIFLEIGDRKD